MSRVVVMPEEGWTGYRLFQKKKKKKKKKNFKIKKLPVLLLVWQRLRTLGPFRVTQPNYKLLGLPCSFTDNYMTDCCHQSFQNLWDDLILLILPTFKGYLIYMEQKVKFVNTQCIKNLNDTFLGNVVDTSWLHRNIRLNVKKINVFGLHDIRYP